MDAFNECLQSNRHLAEICQDVNAFGSAICKALQQKTAEKRTP